MQPVFNPTISLTPYQIIIIAAVFSAIGVCFIIADIIAEAKNKDKNPDTSGNANIVSFKKENDKVKMTELVKSKEIEDIINESNNTQNDDNPFSEQRFTGSGNETKVRTTFVFEARLFLIVSLVIIFAVACFNRVARNHGAYGDFDRTESVSSLIHSIKYGYKDQSKELPDNLSGKIIIYFRFGCEDCDAVHDELMSMHNSLDNKDDIYFVSTRSDAAQTVLQDYPVSEVPMAIYVYNTPVNGASYAHVFLYEPANKDTEKSVFIADNLEQLLLLQKEGM